MTESRVTNHDRRSTTPGRRDIPYYQAKLKYFRQAMFAAECLGFRADCIAAIGYCRRRISQLISRNN